MLCIIVQPQWVICLGSGEESSAYQLVKSKLILSGAPVKAAGTVRLAAKRCKGEFEGANGKLGWPVNVLAVAHPSRWDPVKVADRELSEWGWPA